ncbi:MAG TPA: DUF2934 domain-containing protein [Steroidobacteraceae bacterium]|nr:DUF2934 domain-containing protein [Steroidobacteraceae bacterium]
MGTQPEEATIRMLAYEIWEERGRPMDGDPARDWIEAERRLSHIENAIDESLDESFPASDPPASHLPDFTASNR